MFTDYADELPGWKKGFDSKENCQKVHDSGLILRNCDFSQTKQEKKSSQVSASELPATSVATHLFLLKAEEKFSTDFVE